MVLEVDVKNIDREPPTKTDRELYFYLLRNFEIIKALIERLEGRFDSSVSGTFVSADGPPKTITVTDGVVTDIA